MTAILFRPQCVNTQIANAFHIFHSFTGSSRPCDTPMSMVIIGSGNGVAPHRHRAISGILIGIRIFRFIKKKKKKTSTCATYWSTDDATQKHFLGWNYWKFHLISREYLWSEILFTGLWNFIWILFTAWDPSGDKSALVYIVTWHRIGTKPLSRLVMTVLRHLSIFITRLQRVSKMADILQATFSLKFSRMKIVVFWFKSMKCIPKGPFDSNPNIGSDNGLVPNRRQAIIWTSDVLFTDACTSLGLIGLRRQCTYLPF